MRRLVSMMALVIAASAAIAFAATSPASAASHQRGGKYASTLTPSVVVFDGAPSEVTDQQIEQYVRAVFPETRAHFAKFDKHWESYYDSLVVENRWLYAGIELGLNGLGSKHISSLATLRQQYAADSASGIERYAVVIGTVDSTEYHSTHEQHLLNQKTLGAVRAQGFAEAGGLERFYASPYSIAFDHFNDASVRGAIVVQVQLVHVFKPRTETAAPVNNYITNSFASECCQRNGLGIIGGRFEVPQCKGEYATLNVIGLRANYEWLFAEGMWAAPDEQANLTIIDVAAMFRKGIFGIGGGPLYFTYTPDNMAEGEEHKGTNQSLGLMARGELAVPLGSHADFTLSGTAAWVPFEGESDHLFGVSASLNLYPGFLNKKSTEGGSK